MQRFEQTQLRKILARAAFGCALVLLLWPATASAFSFGDGFDVNDERCVDASVAEMAAHGVAFTPVVSIDDQLTEADAAAETDGFTETDGFAETPCTTNADADPSSNFCFEDAEGQISTLPSLLAQWRGEQAAGSVINSMMAAMEPASAKQAFAQRGAAEPVTQVAPASIDVEPEVPEGESCSSSPDECRSLPPLPPTLTVDASAPGARQSLYDVNIPTRLSEDDTRAWADLRVGPQHGHRDPPDQPPRA